MASHQILEDEFVAQFGGSSSSLDVARFASECIRSDTIGATVAKLSHKTALLDGAIRREVGLHESSLLEQTAHLALLDEALRTAREGVAVSEWGKRWWD